MTMSAKPLKNVLIKLAVPFKKGLIALTMLFLAVAFILPVERVGLMIVVLAISVATELFRQRQS